MPSPEAAKGHVVRCPTVFESPRLQSQMLRLRWWSLHRHVTWIRHSSRQDHPCASCRKARPCLHLHEIEK